MCFVCESCGYSTHEHNHNGHIPITDESFNTQSFALNTGAAASTAISNLSTYVNTLTSGISWSGVQGQSATVSYSFDTSNLSGLLRSNDISTFDAAQQQTTINALNSISNFANINFVQASNAASADIQFYNGELGGTTAGLTSFQYVGSNLLYAAIGIDYSYQDFATVGSFGYQTLLHEIAHAVGLKHPGNYGLGESGPFLPGYLDNTDETVLSYITHNIQTGFQELDIAAIQYLYGVANGSSSLITSSPVLESAVNETLRATSASELLGGLGSDTLRGSSQNDTVYGGRSRVDLNDSHDYLLGEAGNDQLFGNSGNDTIYGDDVGNSAIGNDLIYGGKNNDLIYGGSGDDSLSGGGDRFDPNDQADTLYGGNGQDSLFGNGNNDQLFGEAGSDTIYGGFGNDYIDGGSGNDIIIGQNGDETILGGSGADAFFYEGNDGVDYIADFNAAEDRLVFSAFFNGSNVNTAQEALALASANGNQTVINLGSGSQVTLNESYENLSLNNFEIVDYFLSQI